MIEESLLTFMNLLDVRPAWAHETEIGDHGWSSFETIQQHPNTIKKQEQKYSKNKKT